MEKKTNSRMAASVTLGIMATLLLTLNIWGSEWYKLIISLFVGVVFGMAVYDYHLITKSLKLAWNEIRKGEKTKKVKAELSKRSVKWIGTLLTRTIIILVNYGLYYLLCVSLAFSVFPISSEPQEIILISTLATMFLLFSFAIVSNMDNEIHDSTLVDSIYEKLGFFKVGYPRKLNSNIYIWGMGWYINFLLLGYLIIRFIILASLFIVQVILSLFLALAILFKLIGHNNKTILIAFSITAGASIGTFSASYFIGITSGLLILGGALVFKRVGAINIGYFFEGKRGWAGRFGDFS